MSMQTIFLTLGQHNQDLNNLNIDGDDIIQGLNKFPKTLPSKYFYHDRGSELFENICEVPECFFLRKLNWEFYSTRLQQLFEAN